MSHDHGNTSAWSLSLKLYKIYFHLTHFWAKKRKTFYFEDYFRVYPEETAFNPLGLKRKARKNDLINYLNHLKFYQFTAQFVNKKIAVDLGCGSGYGCEVLKKAGAKEVYGIDASKHSIAYAKSKFGKYAQFSVQNITDLKEYADNMFDVSVSSEVLEHIKEYQMEGITLDEIKRVTKPGGLIIIGTPNNEIVEDHGFSYEEINNLFKKRFSKFCIFENALTPFDERKSLWKKRFANKKTGIIVSELINFQEIALIDHHTPEIKKGIKAGKFKFGNYQINTKLLHNTHSWLIMAINK